MTGTATSRGAATPGAPARSAAPRYVPWLVATLLFCVAVGYFAGTQLREEAPAVGAAPPMAGPGPGGAPPDISAMSPRERSGRLYDRIMRYVAEGKADSVQFFAPMAMGAFEALPELDLDARYDYGRVAAEAGELQVAREQAEAILRESPTHLLGLILSARAATLAGDGAAAAAAWKRFLAAKDAELRKALPEYQAHGSDITASTQIAEGAR